MPHYHIWTVGCQMNKAESARLAAYFEAQGYQPSASAEKADFIVLNSCVVRQSAEDKVRHKLDALAVLKSRRPAVKLALTGCLVPDDPTELKTQFPRWTISSGRAPSPAGTVPPRPG